MSMNKPSTLQPRPGFPCFYLQDLVVQNEEACPVDYLIQFAIANLQILRLGASGLLTGGQVSWNAPALASFPAPD